MLPVQFDFLCSGVNRSICAGVGTSDLQFLREIAREISEADTVFNFDTIDVDGKPEVQLKCSKRLVGERGFEPPTPWSRRLVSRRINNLAMFVPVRIR